jgi:hypothetical protein
MADTAIPSEIVIAGFVALGGAIAWLAHKWDAGNTRCEERSNALQKELASLRDWTQTKMLDALRDNTNALRQLKREVRELDPTDTESDSDLHKSLGFERQVLEKNERGETTAIIRRVK